MFARVNISFVDERFVDEDVSAVYSTVAIVE